MNKQLGFLDSFVSRRMNWHKQNRTIDRLFNHDISLWHGTGKPGEEIANRLGWLTLPIESQALVSGMDFLNNQLISEGYTTAVLLGMGGSSLAPYVIFQTQNGFEIHPRNSLNLIVLDSTNPEEINNICESIDLNTTIFIVSSKSGTTSETQALSDFFWGLIHKSGIKNPGSHFIGITDPGSQLTEIAQQRKYRAVFTSNPDVGGRFSALSVFGLLPACLAGVNLTEFLNSAEHAYDHCNPSSPIDQNPGLFLGSILAEAYERGKDKVVMVADPEVESFVIWAEQLLAESSGKDDKGMVPVSMEPLISPEFCSNDRLFIHLRSSGVNDPYIQMLMDAGHPCYIVNIHGFYDLAAQFYIWETATALACAQLGVNAFNQPNVQETKALTKIKIDQIRKSGAIEQDQPVYSEKGLDVFWNDAPQSDFIEFHSLFDAFLSQIKSGDYFAINAFIEDNPANFNILQNLRKNITKKKKITTTLGYGPRYLHSTGQLHKGGMNEGVFLVISQDYTKIIDIPGQELSFNQLILAQASGDFDALKSRGRRVIHIHFKDANKLSILKEFN